MNPSKQVCTMQMEPAARLIALPKSPFPIAPDPQVGQKEGEREAKRLTC